VALPEVVDGIGRGYARSDFLDSTLSVAHVWADQQYQPQAAGKPMPIEDSYIAAIARRHNLTIATGHVKDFQRPGIKVFDPFAES